LILCVHGGPEARDDAGWQTGYSKPGQMAAAQGIATFYPNYRGSTGRGVAFSELSQGDPGGKEFDDLVDAVDHLVSIGLVDKAKVGVTGGSYGGYATAWCSTKFTDRFAAGVMFVGISDKISKVGTTDIADEDFFVHLKKRPWDDWQMLLERSPIYWAGAEQDAADHPAREGRSAGESRAVARAVPASEAARTAPVRLVMYPGEGHGNRKACARLDYNLRMMQWMVHYLKGPGGAMPPYEIDYGSADGERRRTKAPRPRGKRDEPLNHPDVKRSSGLALVLGRRPLRAGEHRAPRDSRCSSDPRFGNGILDRDCFPRAAGRGSRFRRSGSEAPDARRPRPCVRPTLAQTHPARFLGFVETTPWGGRSQELVSRSRAAGPPNSAGVRRASARPVSDGQFTDLDGRRYRRRVHGPGRSRGIRESKYGGRNVVPDHLISMQPRERRFASHVALRDAETRAPLAGVETYVDGSSIPQ
jgi:dienelactone hydrolase